MESNAIEIGYGLVNSHRRCTGTNLVGLEDEG